MFDSKFTEAFDKYANSYENQTEDGTVIWDYVDADLCIDKWHEKLGQDQYMSWFNDMDDQFLKARRAA